MALKTLAICAVLAVGATSARGDVLLIDSIEAQASSSIPRPARGATMQRVEANFGAPTQRSAAVGDPPITRWDYPGFVVYFEYDHVIHSVARP
jgi:hypothetical protein